MPPSLARDVCCTVRPSSSARDVAFQLLDVLRLFLDHRLDQIPDRKHADDAPGLHHRQVPETPLGHELHTMMHGVVRGYADRRRAHDVADRGVVRRAIFQDDFSRIVALRNDAEQRALVHHQQGAHMPRRHDFNRSQNRIMRRDGEDLIALHLKQLIHGLHSYLRALQSDTFAPLDYTRAWYEDNPFDRIGFKAPGCRGAAPGCPGCPGCRSALSPRRRPLSPLKNLTRWSLPMASGSTPITGCATMNARTRRCWPT